MSTDLMTAQSEPISIDRTRMRLPSGQYMASRTKKDLIVLHFTAGPTASGAYDSWIHDTRTVGTAYIVDKTGDIYECFDPAYWAYALGIKGPLAGANERRAIQIEIASWGPLKLIGDTLCAWPSNYTRSYCKLSETERYVKATYRGMDYYASIPERQFICIAGLVKYLCEKYEIAKHIPAPALLGQTDLAYFSTFKGIVAHTSFRGDKFDFGPEPLFPWSRLQAVIGT